jgi:hypothetical protein
MNSSEFDQRFSEGIQYWRPWIWPLRAVSDMA